MGYDASWDVNTFGMFHCTLKFPGRKLLAVHIHPNQFQSLFDAYEAWLVKAENDRVRIKKDREELKKKRVLERRIEKENQAKFEAYCKRNNIHCQCDCRKLCTCPCHSYDKNDKVKKPQYSCQ